MLLIRTFQMPWSRGLTCSRGRGSLPAESVPSGREMTLGMPAVTVQLGCCLAAAGFLACTPFDDGSDELVQSESSALSQTNQAGASTTTALSSALGQDWSCLGAAAPAPPRRASAAGAARVVYSLQVLDLATLQPSVGTQVRACGLTDLSCERPVAEPIDVGADGWVDVPLFAGFTGYLELTGAGALPGILVLSEPLTRDSTPGYPYFTLSQAALSALGQAVNIAVDPMLGLVSIRVFDCQGVTALGVQLTKVGPGTPWYFIGGLPSAIEQRTGSEGFGGFANAPPGVAQVNALTAEGVSISGELSMMVRPGWGSHAFVSPARGEARL